MIKSSSGYEFKFNGKSDKPLYVNIAEIIAGDIEKGYLQKKAQLPSINEFSSKYSVARDTIEKAYKQLKKENYISSAPGTGYFVVGKKDTKLKVLLVFNKLSSYKKIVYDTIVKAMGSKAKVDLQIHHYDPHILKEIIDTTAGKYHYYVIMPHFFLHSKKKEYLPILNSVPENELVLLDKRIQGMNGNVMGVFQNFESDIYYALASVVNRLKKYPKVLMVFPKETHHPVEIIKGVQKFCKENNKKFSIAEGLENKKIDLFTLYIVIEEAVLAQLIKMVRKTKFAQGKQIGIISFNESDLKELLDITVITTDFEQMGNSVASIILKRKHAQIDNPFKIIVRNSI